MDEIKIIDIELTERCNLTCTHCYIRQPIQCVNTTSNEMSTKQILSFIKQAYDLNCKRIHFTGGEPLFRNDFKEIYSFTYNLGFSIEISTNGILIDNEILNMFENNKPGLLKISIYGWDETSYAENTNAPEIFNIFVDNLWKLQEKQINFRFRYPPIKNLIENSFNIRRFARNFSLDIDVPYSVFLMGNAWNKQHETIRLIQQRIAPEEAAMQKIKEKNIAISDYSAVFKNLSRKYDGQLFICGAATNRPAINAYGYLQVCHLLRHPDTIFKLSDTNLKETIKQHFLSIRNLITNNQNYLEKCGKCVLRPICNSCPGLSWMEYGTLDDPIKYICDSIHYEALLLGILLSGEKGWEADCRKRLEKIL